MSTEVSAWVLSLQAAVEFAAAEQAGAARQALAEAGRGLAGQSGEALYTSLLACLAADFECHWGQYPQASLAAGKALERWSQAGFSASDPQVRAGVDWFIALAQTSGWQRSAAWSDRLEDGGPPVPDPWLDSLSTGLTLAEAGKGQPAMARLDAGVSLARELQAEDQGVRLALSHLALCLGCFLVGDYPASDEALGEADHWAGAIARSPAQTRILDGFLRCLRALGRTAEADLIAERWSQGQPLFNPWNDLSTGLARAAPSAPGPAGETDWHAQVQTALGEGREGKLPVAIKRLTELREGLPPGDRLAWTSGLLGLLAYRSGDYAHAQQALDEARRQWVGAQADPERTQAYLALLSRAGYSRERELTEEHMQAGRAPLVDPFHDPLEATGMEVLKSAGPADDKAWNVRLRAGLAACREDRYGVASRELVLALEGARRAGSAPASLCQNALAICQQLSGDYGGAEKSYREALELWQRREKAPGDADHLGVFLEGLAEAGYRAESELLAQRWKAGESPLLCPWEELEAQSAFGSMPASRPAGEATPEPLSGPRPRPGLLVVFGLVCLGLIPLAWWFSRPAAPITDRAQLGPVEIRLRARGPRTVMAVFKNAGPSSWSVPDNLKAELIGAGQVLWTSPALAPRASVAAAAERSVKVVVPARVALGPGARLRLRVESAVVEVALDTPNGKAP